MKDQRTEIYEAIQAADNTLSHLHRAQDYLRSAGNWGIADMLGGGMLSTLIKRGKMADAEQALCNARDAMRSFARELRDVDQALDIQLCSNGFLGFADYFFDGAIADWMVQSRIGTARRQVEDATRQIAALKNRLMGML